MRFVADGSKYATVSWLRDCPHCRRCFALAFQGEKPLTGDARSKTMRVFECRFCRGIVESPRSYLDVLRRFY